MKNQSLFTCGLLLLALAIGPASSMGWACGLAWSPTVADALRGAGLTSRLAVVVFTGSDWSAKGLQLDQEVLMNAEFAERFVSHFALANADFPQRQVIAPDVLAENTALAAKHDITEWPTLLALRPDGSEFARFTYAGETASEALSVIESWHTRYKAELQAAGAASVASTPAHP